MRTSSAFKKKGRWQRWQLRRPAMPGQRLWMSLMHERSGTEQAVKYASLMLIFFHCCQIRRVKRGFWALVEFICGGYHLRLVSFRNAWCHIDSEWPPRIRGKALLRPGVAAAWRHAEIHDSLKRNIPAVNYSLEAAPSLVLYSTPSAVMGPTISVPFRWAGYMRV